MAVYCCRGPDVVREETTISITLVWWISWELLLAACTLQFNSSIAGAETRSTSKWKFLEYYTSLHKSIQKWSSILSIEPTECSPSSRIYNSLFMPPFSLFHQHGTIPAHGSFCMYTVTIYTLYIFSTNCFISIDVEHAIIWTWRFFICVCAAYKTLIQTQSITWLPQFCWSLVLAILLLLQNYCSQYFIELVHINSELAAGSFIFLVILRMTILPLRIHRFDAWNNDHHLSWEEL